jgi:hypothetical protein
VNGGKYSEEIEKGLSEISKNLEKDLMVEAGKVEREKRVKWEYKKFREREREKREPGRNGVELKLN